jgi:hypothetical protein
MKLMDFSFHTNSLLTRARAGSTFWGCRVAFGGGRMIRLWRSRKKFLGDTYADLANAKIILLGTTYFNVKSIEKNINFGLIINQQMNQRKTIVCLDSSC